MQINTYRAISQNEWDHICGTLFIVLSKTSVHYYYNSYYCIDLISRELKLERKLDSEIYIVAQIYCLNSTKIQNFLSVISFVIMSLGYKLNCFNSVCPNKCMFKKERKKETYSSRIINCLQAPGIYNLEQLCHKL